MIRAVAVENKAIFITSDKVQAEVARAKGLDVEYLYPRVEELKPLHIAEFLFVDGRIDPLALDPIGRLGGPMYTHVTKESMFNLPRPTVTPKT